MGIHQRLDDGKALIRAAEHADLAVGFRHILHQPVDDVVGVGRFIGVAGIEGPSQKASHERVAFRSIFSAYVLKNSDVPISDKYLIPLWQDGQHLRGAGSLGSFRRVVRCTCENYRRILCALRNHDNRVQLDSVAHGNHYIALNEVEGCSRSFEFCRDVWFERRSLSVNRGCDRQKSNGQHKAPKRRGKSHASFPHRIENLCEPVTAPLKKHHCSGWRAGDVIAGHENDIWAQPADGCAQC